MVKKSKNANIILQKLAQEDLLDELMVIEFEAFSKKICLFKKLEKILNRNTVNFKLRNLGIILDFTKEELEKLQKILSRNTIKTMLKRKGIEYSPQKYTPNKRYDSDRTIVSKDIKNKPLKVLGSKRQKQIFKEIENQKNKTKEEIFNLLDKDTDKYIENREL